MPQVFAHSVARTPLPSAGVTPARAIIFVTKTYLLPLISRIISVIIIWSKILGVCPSQCNDALHVSPVISFRRDPTLQDDMVPTFLCEAEKVWMNYVAFGRKVSNFVVQQL